MRLTEFAVFLTGLMLGLAALAAENHRTRSQIAVHDQASGLTSLRCDGDHNGLITQDLQLDTATKPGIRDGLASSRYDSEVRFVEVHDGHAVAATRDAHSGDAVRSATAEIHVTN